MKEKQINKTGVFIKGDILQSYENKHKAELPLYFGLKLHSSEGQLLEDKAKLSVCLYSLSQFSCPDLCSSFCL
jgi:hypothetical protein